MICSDDFHLVCMMPGVPSLVWDFFCIPFGQVPSGIVHVILCRC